MSSQPVQVSHGEVITDFDEFASIRRCTPERHGTKACFEASTDDGQTITLKVCLESPLENFCKSFSIDGNVQFTWQPISRLKIVIGIEKWEIHGDQICFTLYAKLCVKVPFFGWDCLDFDHRFCVPIPGAIDEDFDREDPQAFINALLIRHLLKAGSENPDCNCGN